MNTFDRIRDIISDMNNSEIGQDVINEISKSMLPNLLKDYDSYTIYSSWDKLDFLAVLSTRLIPYKEHIYEMLEQYSYSFNKQVIENSAHSSAEIIVKDIREKSMFLSILAIYFTASYSDIIKDSNVNSV